MNRRANPAGLLIRIIFYSVSFRLSNRRINPQAPFQLPVLESPALITNSIPSTDERLFHDLVLRSLNLSKHFSWVWD
jgi:hypothetical protein